MASLGVKDLGKCGVRRKGLLCYVLQAMRNLLGATERWLLGAESCLYALGAETQVLDCGSKWLSLCLRRERLLKALDGCKRRILSIITRLNVLEVFEVFS